MEINKKVKIYLLPKCLENFQQMVCWILRNKMVMSLIIVKKINSQENLILKILWKIIKIIIILPIIKILLTIINH